MYSAECKGINSFLVKASQLLLKKGVSRQTRGSECIELPEPCIFKITNPTARIVTITKRKWNPILPYAESLWIASGRNDLNFIGHYLKKMADFSDDGDYVRAGYGSRIRNFNGIPQDYKIGETDNKQEKYIANHIDQFKYVYLSFQRDENTRQAIITIGDPPKDCFDEKGNLKETKDYPCTRLLQFQKQANTNKLDLTVYMRSNDLIWGASAVNIFNFTLMQEYFAQMLGLEVGCYFHVANNLHYYKEFQNKVEAIAKISEKDIFENEFSYSKSFRNFDEFEILLKKLRHEEKNLRLGKEMKVRAFEDEFFDDWYKTFYVFNRKKMVNFSNPILNDIFKKYTI